MNSHYHDPGDLKQLKRMHELAPVEFEAWLNLDKIVARTDGAIPHKYRELMALAVALTTQCPYCIEAHAHRAKRAGPSAAGTAKPLVTTAALRWGAAAPHGPMARTRHGEDAPPGTAH